MSLHKEVEDAEDLPSDFFDDFNKEEFMEGLSVIDSWDDDKPRGSRINAEAIDSVRDLRELIGDGREDERSERAERGDWRERQESGHSRSDRTLDDYIKPGSRRDPSKTNEAIRRDKEVKVKEYLAKKIEANTDDLRPPGTELDDYLDDSKLLKKSEERGEKRSTEKRHESPKRRRRRSRSRSPRRYSPRRSPRRRPSRSPLRYRRDVRERDRERVRPPPPSSHHSPRRYSPRRVSPRWEQRRERSPSPPPRRRREPTPDSFLYPKESHHAPSYHQEPFQQELFPGPRVDYPPIVPGYSYPPAPSYPGSFLPQFGYGLPPQPEPMVAPPMPVPQPVPAPLAVPGPIMGGVPHVAPTLTIPTPSPIPRAPQISPAPQQQPQRKLDSNPPTPFDALAQLVADGKLSKEDYLKLAPNKSKSARLYDANTNSSVETKARVEVIKRCDIALSKTGTLRIPNHLVINLAMLGSEQKSLPPKFCSPLKRQATTDFFFTTPSANTAAAHNKQLIDSIYAAVGLTDVARVKKQPPKNMKDAASQTTKPFCEVCEIREATSYYDTATSVDHEHFSSSVHTQVIEQDLLSSKSVFTPSGGVGDSMSIAHLTPAQLVSQLAARAKTLKQTEPPPSQFRRPPPGNYDDRGGPGRYDYQNYNNYNRY